MPYRHPIRPRYGEIDMQGVVFNAHYLAYCDDACDSWMRAVVGSFEGLGWDFMLKRAELTWHGAARLGDELAIEVGLSRVGTTSFDVGFAGSVGERPVFEATITYVCVTHGTVDPIAVPAVLRAQLEV